MAVDLPLAAHQAAYSHDNGRTWKLVLAHCRIGQSTLASLGPAWWVGGAIWRVDGHTYSAPP